MKFESEWTQQVEEESVGQNTVCEFSARNDSVISTEKTVQGLSESEIPSEVLDLVQTISQIQLPKEPYDEERKTLFKKLLSNRDLVVQKKSLKESLVTDENEKWLIIEKLSQSWKETPIEGEEEEEGDASNETQDVSYLNIKHLETMMKQTKKPNNSLVFCKECNLFMKRSSFGGHSRFVHKKIRKYLCQTCGYAAHTGSILRQHIQAVHVGYTFECDKCSKKFNLVKRLRKHKELCHSKASAGPEKSLLCHYCGLAFSRLSYLKIHLLTHTGETPLQCQYCDRRFKFRWAMIQHERLHTGVKPYKCEFCDERFTQNRVRKTHEFKVHGKVELVGQGKT